MKTISFIISTKTIKHLGTNPTRKKKKIIKRYQRTQKKTEVNGLNTPYFYMEIFNDLTMSIQLFPQINPIKLMQSKKISRIFHRTWKVKYMIKVFQINEEKIDYLIRDVEMAGSLPGNKTIQMPPRTIKKNKIQRDKSKLQKYEKN